jgi:hypothetical protein
MSSNYFNKNNNLIIETGPKVNGESIYEGESVNTTQMDIKRNTRDILTWKKHILHQHWYTCPIALPVRWNPQHTCLVSATSAPPFEPLRHQGNICQPVVNRFTRQTLPTFNRNHFFMNILCIQSFSPQKTHKSTVLFGIILLKHGRHFDYWNQPVNMSMRVCYVYTPQARSPFWLLKPDCEH